MELPCCAQRPRYRPARGGSTVNAGQVLCLFLLDRAGQRIVGAVDRGRILDPVQAQQLWQAHQWEPSATDQHWPADFPHLTVQSPSYTDDW